MRLQQTNIQKSEQLLPTFDYTITVLNMLKAQQSATKLDIWYKSVLHNNTFITSTVRSITGTRVSIGSVFTSRVPKNILYKPYNEWSMDPSQGFTFSVGDKIIKGEIDESLITSQTISQIMQKYQPNAFTIKVFRDNTGTIELAEHYYLEGV